MRRILAMLLALALCFSMVMSLTACKKEEEEKKSGKKEKTEEETDETDETDSTDETGDDDWETDPTYYVTVVTADGTAVEGCEVYAYQDEDLEDLLSYCKTDEDGVAYLVLAEGEYYITLDGCPEGCEVEPYYVLDSYEMEIVLQGQGQQQEQGGKTCEYSVSVMSNTGLIFEGKTVEICKQDGSVVASGKTDSDGRFYTDLPEGKYYARLKDAPEGYYVAQKAEFSDEIAGIYLVPLADAAMGQTNSLTYETEWMMPRGLMAKFQPETSGVYLIYAETDQDVDGFVMDTRDTFLATPDQRPYNLELEQEYAMVCPMEAGQTYYISWYYWDQYTLGTISFEIEKLPEDYQPLTACAPGVFGYDAEGNLTADNYINVKLGSDGYYYEDLGNGKQGSGIYANFAGVTGVLSNPLVTSDEGKGVIELGGFDFTQYADGSYNSDGEDCTAEAQAYAQKMITEGELAGFVPVDARLAELLQMLMDKYTYAGVEYSWLKMCCYYAS